MTKTTPATMNQAEAESLAESLNDEAQDEDTGWTFEAVQSCQLEGVWAVAGQDEDGTPTSLWINPELCFPVCF